MRRRIEEIERRIGDIEKDIAVLQSRVPVPEQAYGMSGCLDEPGPATSAYLGDSIMKESAMEDSDMEGSAEEPGYDEKLRRPIAKAASRSETPGVFHNRIGEPYSIKLVYPTFYRTLDIGIPYCTIGFPTGKERLAKKVQQGTLFFVYITTPVRRVIGLAQAMGPAEYRGDVDFSRPWVVTLEWVIGPKSDGVSFADVGLEVRARTGDSVYAIPTSVATDLMEQLNDLCDLDRQEIAELRERFRA